MESKLTRKRLLKVQPFETYLLLIRWVHTKLNSAVTLLNSCENYSGTISLLAESERQAASINQTPAWVPLVLSHPPGRAQLQQGKQD